MEIEDNDYLEGLNMSNVLDVVEKMRQDHAFKYGATFNEEIRLFAQEMGITLSEAEAGRVYKYLRI